MIDQNGKKYFIYAAFASVFVIGSLAMSDTIVRSRRATTVEPSPFKFKRPPALENHTSNTSPELNTPGSLDSKWTTDFGSIERAHAIAVQPDGKIVSVGTVSLNEDHDFAVFRYIANGSLDTSFDSDGKVTTSFSSGNDAANDVAVQPDGKIVVAGTDGSTAALVRYNTDGSLDASFGAGGKVVASAIGPIGEIAIQTDGKIVVGGAFAVGRLNSNGSLDASFGTGGVSGHFFNQSQVSVALQADGKVVAAGSAVYYDDWDNVYCDFVLVRYNADGSLDTSFDTDGRLTTTFGGDYEYPNAVVIQADGKIVAAGWGDGLAIARYNADGSLDASFDEDGKATINSGGSANSAVLQSNGKIVVSGENNRDFALVRLNPDGSLDTSFDADGKLTTDFGHYESAFDVAVQPDGKIVTAGPAFNDSASDLGGSDFALARYNPDGSLDTSFYGDGKVTTTLVDHSSAANTVVFNKNSASPCSTFVAGYVDNGANTDLAVAIYDQNGQICAKRTTPIGSSDDRANGAAAQSDGAIVVAGYSSNGSNKDFALVRYFESLEIDDTQFGVNGKVTTDFGGSNDEADAVAIQADGKIVAVGQTIINGSPTLALARYNTNGSLDTSFGTGGKVILHSIQYPRAMAIQADGKIFAAGSATHNDSPFNFAVARFNSDGSLDTTFDGDGIAVTRFDLASQINTFALQPNGKIVAAGFTRDNTLTVYGFALARYNTNGSLDVSFDGDGKVTTLLEQRSSANAVSIQRNGKIVAVGGNYPDVDSDDFVLACYNPNGLLDLTFDTDGMQTTDFSQLNDQALASAILPDGSIIAAGSSGIGGVTDFALARYVPNRAAWPAQFDFDGDGRTDTSVFRPNEGNWYLNKSSEGFHVVSWGLAGDKVVPGDYDGDGKTDTAVFRPTDGRWYVVNSSDSTFAIHAWGLPGDVPVLGDFDKDAITDRAVFRPSEAKWYVLKSSGGIWVSQFGNPGDQPVPADYDGDGLTDRAVYRNGRWQTVGGTLDLGSPGDIPVPADYDGNGFANFAVFRPSNGRWYILGQNHVIAWGLAGDIPVPGDYDGDGKTDPAVYRNGTWYLRQSTSGISVRNWGLAGDRPVPAAYLP